MHAAALTPLHRPAATAPDPLAADAPAPTAPASGLADGVGAPGLMEALPLALFVHDPLGRIRAVNARACESLGYSRAELLTMQVFDIECDFSLAQAQEQWQRLAHQPSLTLRGRHRRRDGSLFAVELQVVQWRNGTELLYGCVAQDITRRLQTEAALHAREQLLQAIYLQAPLGIGVAELSGQLLRCNPAYCAMLGYSELELCHLTLAELLHRKDMEATRDLLSQLKAGHLTHFTLECRYLHRNGHSVWVSKYVCLKPDDLGGAAPQLLELVWDTSARRAPAQRQQDGADPHSTARPGTGDGVLVSQTLQTTHTLANELNQPLNALLLFAEAGQRLLKTTPGLASDKLRRCLNGVSGQAQRAGQVLQQLVDFLPRENLALSELALNDLVQHAVNSARNRHGGTLDSPLEVLPCVPQPRVLGHPQQLEKVISSLIDNRLAALALQPADDARVRLSVGLTPDNTQALVSIQGGRGQDKDTLEALFEAFFPAPHEGPGLSLPLCRAIIASHGGQLWASEGAGGESAFHFTLRLAGHA